MKPALSWRDMGAADAAQQARQIRSFAHVGGPDQRDSLVAPWCALGHEREYLEGYEAGAAEAYGPDWRTRTFDPAPDLTVPETAAE